MEYVERVKQLSPQNIITNAMTLMSGLSYICWQNRRTGDMPWLSEQRIIERAAGRPESKRARGLTERLEQYVQVFEHGASAAAVGAGKKVYGWWRAVPNVSRRELYVCLPLQSPPIEPDDINLFKDRAPRYYKDPLDITKKSMADTKGVLDELGVSKRSYVLFIDDIWRLPVPVRPEKWSDKVPQLDSIPEQLQDYFEEHAVYSKLILNCARTVRRMRLHIKRKELYSVPLNDRELELKGDETGFKKKLSTDIALLKAMTDLQLRQFWQAQTTGRQLGKDYWIYAVGAVGDTSTYLESLGSVGWDASRYWIKPLEGVSDSTSRYEVVRQGLVTAPRTMDKLKNLIEQTALRDRPELRERPQSQLSEYW